MAAMASTIGTARGSTHGSCLPFVEWFSTFSFFEKLTEFCPIEIEGVILSGTYEECLKNVPDEKWQAGIVLLGNAGNENNCI